MLAAGSTVTPTITLTLLAETILVQARSAQFLAHIPTTTISAVALILNANAAGTDLNRRLGLRNGRVKPPA
jgi:hypothetical protein